MRTANCSTTGCSAKERALVSRSWPASQWYTSSTGGASGAEPARTSSTTSRRAPLQLSRASREVKATSGGPHWALPESSPERNRRSNIEFHTLHIPDMHGPGVEPEGHSSARTNQTTTIEAAYHRKPRRKTNVITACRRT